MKIENNFSKDSVLIDYYIKYNNNVYIKFLYTFFDSWRFCENEVNYYIIENYLYCPYIEKIKIKIKLLLTFNHMT